MKFVLHLNHWQLFLIMFGLPFVFYITFFMSMAANIMSNLDEYRGEPSVPMSGVVMIALFGIAYLAAIVIGISWVYQVATGLYKKLPAGNNMKIKRFYFAFFYPPIYFILIFAGLGIFFLTMATRTSEPETISPLFGLVFLVIPLHILAIACMFYVMYFIAKSLKSFELQREAQVGEFIAEFVLIWFSFIGIWFIQPRINQIFSDNPQVPVTTGGPIDSM